MSTKKRVRVRIFNKTQLCVVGTILTLCFYSQFYYWFSHFAVYENGEMESSLSSANLIIEFEFKEKCTEYTSLGRTGVDE